MHVGKVRTRAGGASKTPPRSPSSMKKHEILAIVAALPDAGDFLLSISELGGDELTATDRRSLAAARSARYRARKRDASRDERDGGGKGVVCLGSEKEAEKSGKETGILLTGQIREGEVSVTRHVTERDANSAGSGRAAVLLGPVVSLTDREGAKAVWEFWKVETGHLKAKLDKKRGRRIAARLSEGFTVEELKTAIRNRKNDPWLMGTSPGSDGKVYDGLETLLRDAAQVERLRDLTSAPRAVPRAQNGAYAPPTVVGPAIPSAAETRARQAAEERAWRTQNRNAAE